MEAVVSHPDSGARLPESESQLCDLSQATTLSVLFPLRNSATVNGLHLLIHATALASGVSTVPNT